MPNRRLRESTSQYEYQKVMENHGRQLNQEALSKTSSPASPTEEPLKIPLLKSFSIKTRVNNTKVKIKCKCLFYPTAPSANCLILKTGLGDRHFERIVLKSSIAPLS